MLADERVGRYRIISKIGSGGMGEVFLAEDTKLGREVALKTLPADVASDAERMHRFISEAKTASSLNHPNIITIFEINDESDVPYIAMEHVRGETLARAIRSKKLDLAKIMDVALQVSGALAAAHEAGVVHRDIKPDNIIIRTDGLLKVLDFGLAKLTENDGNSDPEAETVAHRTNPGMIIGTASFMSPEQARGKDVDARSDIFSFGTVLYQMVAGKLPFTGENYVDVIASILYKEPVPITQIAPDTPHDIQAIIRKCLRKNRDERFQTVRELLADIKEICAELGVQTSSAQRVAMVSDPGTLRVTDDTITRPVETERHSGYTTGSISHILFDGVRQHPIRSGLSGVLLVGALLAGAYGVSRISGTAADGTAFLSMRFDKATTGGNVASEKVAISPDGKYVVYVASEHGKESLWLKQAATQTNILTAAASDSGYIGLTYSRDGTYLYYVTELVGGTTVLNQMPVLGGTSRKLLTDISSSVAFSQDGRQMSFVRGSTSLMAANADGGDLRLLAEAENGEKWLLSSWSPDGQNLVAAVYSPVDSYCHLVELPASGGAARRLPTPPWLRISGLAWSPDQENIFVVGRDPETELSQVWHVSYPEGAVRRVTNDLANYLGLSLASDGKTIATVHESRVANIWRFDPAENLPAVRLTSEIGRDEGMSGVAWLPNGRIVYTVRSRGSQDLWIADGDGGNNRQLTFNSRSNFSPVASPDGKTIVFVSTRGGDPDLWAMDANGENVRQLTDHPGIEVEPDITPDGKFVVYGVNGLDNRNSLWKVRLAGGSPIMLTETGNAAGRPKISPDGRYIAFELGLNPDEAVGKLAIIGIDGGETRQIFDLPQVLRSRSFHWSPDGKSIIYVDTRDTVDNLWSQPLPSGPARQLTDFRSDRIYRFDIAASDGRITMSRGNQTSDVIRITGFN